MKLRSAALTLSLAALASTVLAQANSFQMINESGRTIGDPTDVTSTLDGKPVALKRYALGWNKAKGALYADADGTLMQADIGTINISYIRAKFKLDTASAP